MVNRRRNRNVVNDVPEAPNANFMNEFREMARAMRDQADSTARMAERFDRRERDDNPGSVFTKFQRANPPRFKGTIDADEAEDWLKVIEKIFKAQRCPEDQQVDLVTFLLDGDADFWWEGTKQLLEHDGTEITWNVFKESFFEKYIPPSVRNARELKFLSLTQGSMTIPEYTAEFEKLSRFSTICQLNPSEEWRCIKYEGGLREDILAAVGHLEIRTFTELANKCKLAEENIKKLKTAQANRREVLRRESHERLSPQEFNFKPHNHNQRRLVPRNNHGDHSSDGKSNDDDKSKRPGQETVTPETSTVLPCPQCGKDHGGRPCLAGTGACFVCGQMGHQARVCPNRRRLDPSRFHR